MCLKWTTNNQSFNSRNQEITPKEVLKSPSDTTNINKTKEIKISDLWLSEGKASESSNKSSLESTLILEKEGKSVPSIDFDQFEKAKAVVVEFQKLASSETINATQLINFAKHSNQLLQDKSFSKQLNLTEKEIGEIKEYSNYFIATGEIADKILHTSFKDFHGSDSEKLAKDMWQRDILDAVSNRGLLPSLDQRKKYIEINGYDLISDQDIIDLNRRKGTVIRHSELGITPDMEINELINSPLKDINIGFDRNKTYEQKKQSLMFESDEVPREWAQKLQNELLITKRNPTEVECNLFNKITGKTLK